jgi:AraC-like DNA-binding protein
MFRENIGFNLNLHVKTFINGIEDYPLHMHPDVMEIICILEGSVGISDSSLSYRLDAGDVYIFNANDPHCIRNISDDNTILFLYIDINHYKDYFANLKKMYFICDSYRKDAQLEDELIYIRFLMAGILYRYEANRLSGAQIEENARLLVKFFIDNMQFYTYERDEFNHLEITKRREPMPKNAQLTRIYHIVDYIYDHFREKMQLKDIAGQEYLTTYYLSHFIRQACGLTFHELLSLARCEEAEKQLGATNRSIDAIAADVGFSGRKHLGIQFRKWYRMLPSEYRRKRRQEEDQNSLGTKYRAYDKRKAYSIIRTYLEQGNTQSLLDDNTLRNHLDLLRDSWQLYETLQKRLTDADADVAGLFALDSLIPVGDFHSFIENYDHYLKAGDKTSHP